jgi:N-acetylneuraminic acid mutarotase
MDIDRTNYRSADIRSYDPIAKQWEIVGRMSTPRRRCYAAVLLDEHLMVVGGLADNGRNGMDAFEIASVTTV